jgi:cytochrome P450 family 6
MFPIIKNCGQVLEDYLVKNFENKVDIAEVRDLVARLNTNIISSVAFGIDNDCINDSEHIFRKMGARVFETTLKNGLKGTLGFIAPNIFHTLGFKFLDDDLNEFFWSVVQETVGYREKNNFSRPDFLQLLIQLKNQGYLSVDKNDINNDEAEISKDKTTDNKKLTMNQLFANVFLFFIAGFETSSSTASYCLAEIAKNQEIQRKVQEEIDEILKETGGDLTYDAIMKFKYLEMCIDETLRKYPIVPLHFRQTVKDYKINGTDIIIPKDTAVIIPVIGMQRDPEIYDDPLKFDPERFRESSTGGGKVEGTYYTPFGDGPRNCIGMRLGKIMTKLSIIKILTKFNIEHTDNSLLTSEIEFHPTQMILTPKKLFKLKLTMRK